LLWLGFQQSLKAILLLNLENAVKALILQKDAKWMEAEEALELFAKAEQWGDEQLKLKAMETIIS